MDIAGGVYKESCLVPEWNAEYGSGGRAAAAIAALSPGVILHTYASTPHSSGLDALTSLGVDVRVHPASHGIAFAYFHPLSNPHIEPRRHAITRHAPIQVSAEAVLRFGFLEGDAVVTANRAVHDPQTFVEPERFAANGSRAEELALVLNEEEARALSGEHDVRDAARALLHYERAEVVVVKAGVRGALVAERGGDMTEVPAYRSDRVFKIGTGDVFSSVFAFEWAERKRGAPEAATLASQSVSRYCSTRRLPLSADPFLPGRPVIVDGPPVVLLVGETATIGQRYVMEEARYRLNELGATVVSPALDAIQQVDAKILTSALFVADAASADLESQLQRLLDENVPIVLFDERVGSEAPTQGVESRVCAIDDFASAVYFAFWAASPKRA